MLVATSIVPLHRRLPPPPSEGRAGGEGTATSGLHGALDQRMAKLSVWHWRQSAEYDRKRKSVAEYAVWYVPVGFRFLDKLLCTGPHLTGAFPQRPCFVGLYLW